MDEQFGISRGDVEAAEAETARKLAADREADMESGPSRLLLVQGEYSDCAMIL